MNRKISRHGCLAAALLALSSAGALAQESGSEDKEVVKLDVAGGAIAILEAQMAKSPAERIPLTVRHAAKCVALFPQVIKAGIIIAAKRGRGLVSCRNQRTGEWGAPAYYNITEASIGLQAGIQNASLMLLVVDDAGVQRLLAEKLAFGGDISVAAGPLGAAKQVNLDSSVVSYARTEGVFAGLQLGGSSVTYDKAENLRVYGADVTPATILIETAAAPEELEQLRRVLVKYAPKQQ